MKTILLIIALSLLPLTAIADQYMDQQFGNIEYRNNLTTGQTETILHFPNSSYGYDTKGGSSQTLYPSGNPNYKPPGQLQQPNTYYQWDYNPPGKQVPEPPAHQSKTTLELKGTHKLTPEFYLKKRSKRKHYSAKNIALLCTIILDAFF